MPAFLPSISFRKMPKQAASASGETEVEAGVHPVVACRTRASRPGCLGRLAQTHGDPPPQLQHPHLLQLLNAGHRIVFNAFLGGYKRPARGSEAAFSCSPPPPPGAPPSNATSCPKGQGEKIRGAPPTPRSSCS